MNYQQKILSFILGLGLITCGFGQKIGVVDTNYILSKMPEYQSAESRLEKQVEAWQSEITQLQSELENKKFSFENEKVLLIGEQLKQRETEIKDLETKIKNLIDNHFGTNGDVNKMRTNLVKPFQDQIWNAIKDVVTKNSLGIVLDKSNSVNVLFLDKKYDYTDKILDVILKNHKK